MPDRSELHEGWINAAIRAGLKETMPMDDSMKTRAKSVTPIEDRTDSDRLREPAKNMERGRAIAEEALWTINGERQDAYGDPENTFGIIAGMWSAYLGIAISKRDVSLMMVQLKVARLRNGVQHKDSFVDLLGYGMLACEMEA